jgi:hypothetical protein
MANEWPGALIEKVKVSPTAAASDGLSPVAAPENDQAENPLFTRLNDWVAPSTRLPHSSTRNNRMLQRRDQPRLSLFPLQEVKFQREKSIKTKSKPKNMNL